MQSGAWNKIRSQKMLVTFSVIENKPVWMQLVYPPCCLPELYVPQGSEKGASTVKLREWFCAWLQVTPTWELLKLPLGPYPDHLNQNLWCETRA